MHKKTLLFAGIFLLVIGIFIRRFFDLGLLGLVLIISGVICKTIYIIDQVRSGRYSPGREMLFLGLGLILFLSGLYLKRTEIGSINPNYLIYTGLLLKLVFILMFIRLIKKSKFTHP